MFCRCLYPSEDLLENDTSTIDVEQYSKRADDTFFCATWKFDLKLSLPTRMDLIHRDIKQVEGISSNCQEITNK